ncbi:MAG: agmatine deiminase family protein [Planctomycetes bacterium]|nr:agmatine deiminase family protein [Planctomycetota bacterium]
MAAYRLPAEWEPHAATWIAWPHRRATFLGPFAEIPPAYERIARLIARYEPVRIIGPADVLAAARVSLADTQRVAFIDIPTDDSWIRDTGPVFLVPRQRAVGDKPLAACFGWNAWGGKYPPWDADAGVARAIAGRLGLDAVEPGIVLEGGAIETDGAGTLLANERCVVDPKRNLGLDRAAMGRALRKQLVVEQIVWVGGELMGDDTDGHIDQLARFVAPGRVLAARQPDRLDPNRTSLEANLEILAAATDAAGRRLEVVPLDIPARFAFEGTQLPASHLNFLVGNGFVAVPVFGGPTDERALRVIESCFPGRAIEPVDCTALVRGRGGIHCVTRDEPA